jgi:hypothetical protein
MHVLAELAIQGSVGFVIGAGTNELAIRWVFWAIFAKKKREIAAAVQRVVSCELMSPDKIARRLRSPEVAQSLQESLLAALTEAAARHWPSLDALARDGAGLRLDALQAQLASLASGAVASRLAEPSFRDEVLRPFLEEQWGHLSAKRPADLLPPPTRALLDGLPARLAEAVLAPEHRAKLCAVIADGLRSWMADYPTPAAFLGSANTDEVAALAGSRTRLFGEELAGLLATPPAQEALRAAMRGAVQARLGEQGPIGQILSGLSGSALVENQLAKFCETLPAAVRGQLDDAATAIRLRGLVEAAVRKLLGRTWGELIDAGAADALERHVQSLLGSDAVRDMVRHGFESVTGLGSRQPGKGNAGRGRRTAGGRRRCVRLPGLGRRGAARGAAFRGGPAAARASGRTGRPQAVRAPDRAAGSFSAGGRQAEAGRGAGRADRLVRERQLDGAGRADAIWDVISESIVIYDEKKWSRSPGAWPTASSSGSRFRAGSSG